MISVYLQGGLGNMMFQIATAYAVAKDNQADLFLLEGQQYAPFGNNRVETYQDNILKNISFRSSLPDLRLLKETTHGYVEMPEVDDVLLYGYFQSDKYFNHHRKSLLDLFGFTQNEVKNNNVSMHVRRGDYLQIPKALPTQPEHYYREALTRIGEYEKLYIFSDDVEWCKETFSDLDVIYQDTNKDHEDLFLMTQQRHHIIANSSFSWWGAWLAQSNGKVIYPKLWFGPEGPDTSKDIPKESWIGI